MNNNILASFLYVVIPLFGLMHPAQASPNDAAPETTTITLNAGVTYQTIDGFGTTLGTMVSASRLDLWKMNPAQRTQLLDALFSTKTGAGMSILRMEAGMGLYYLTSYPCYTIEPTSPGAPTNTPTYQWDGDCDHLVWAAKQAMRRGVRTIYLDAWSAPAFMKVKGDWKGDSGLDPQWNAAFARYLVKYIQSYASSGVTITHIGLCNEPDLRACWYQGMVIDPPQVTDIIKELGSSLTAEGLKTKIVGPECTGYAASCKYLDTILADPVAKDYLAVASAHGYGGPVSAIPAAAAAGKPTWQSEYSPIDEEPWNPNYSGPDGGVTTSDLIINALNTGVNAYLDWSNGGGNQLLFRLVNPSTFHDSKRFWVYANYSRYIRPGAVRISATSSDPQVLVTAVRNRNGSYVVVINNHKPSPSTLTLHGVTGGKVIPYVTNDALAMAQQPAVRIQNGAVSIDLPANSTVTYRLIGATVQGKHTDPLISEYEGSK